VVEAVEALPIMASARGVSIAVQGSQEACQAWFDNKRLSKVLANLISNSIKFTPKGAVSA
jgi:signal transduction histidine kinase